MRKWNFCQTEFSLYRYAVPGTRIEFAGDGKLIGINNKNARCAPRARDSRGRIPPRNTEIHRAARPPEFCADPSIFSTSQHLFSGLPRSLRRFWAFMDRTERHTNYPNLFRSTSLIHYLLVIFHWNGCLYHIVYKNNGFGSKNWVYDDSEKTDVITQYLQSCYWCTLALTTIGDLPR